MMGYGCVIDGMEMSSYEPVKNPEPVIDRILAGS